MLCVGEGDELTAPEDTDDGAALLGSATWEQSSLRKMGSFMRNGQRPKRSVLVLGVGLSVFYLPSRMLLSVALIGAIMRWCFGVAIRCDK